MRRFKRYAQGRVPHSGRLESKAGEKVAEEIISVGIDIGTSTTQLIFSRFLIENTASVASVPRISIVDKQIIYQSGIYITPLICPQRIDENAVRDIVLKEYSLAGITPGAVTTGAVIITGETARKENASTILAAVSGLAGDFVVATAGQDLEGVIAGKGSGAASISLDQHKTTANLDVGGGTTNIAVFNEGDVSASFCFDIGGRLIKLGQDMVIDYISPKLTKHSEKIGLSLKKGQKASKHDLQKICSWMAKILFVSLGFSDKSDTVKPGDLGFMATAPLTLIPAPEVVTFSGGVADYIYNTDITDEFPHGDIGALLGSEIRSAFNEVWNRVQIGVQTIRATVIGAGMYSTELSGSTITYENIDFPLKNIPIIRLSKREEMLPPAEFAEIVRQRLDWFKDEHGQAPAALSITGEHNITYYMLTQYAQRLALALKPLGEARLPQIVLVEHDMAKALGQMLLLTLESRRLICIDSVSTSQGDYIDIGNPLMGGRVLPVVIKTLVFN